ncbi:hypothetical protein ACQPU1_10200 [Clostridium paraputrificum]|uniref:hypothetical protein n=1 Tax=Clostridium TaxID=1485 RepID=UPI003D33DEAB
MDIKVEKDLMREIHQEEIEGSIIGETKSLFPTLTLNTINSTGVLDCFWCIFC